MNRLRHATVLLAFILICSLPKSAEAFCGGDNGWTGAFASIAVIGATEVAVQAGATIEHIFPHIDCYGEIVAKAIVVGAGCSDTDYTIHYMTDPSETGTGFVSCDVGCGPYSYRGGGEISWNGNSDFTYPLSSNSVRFPCDCSPPPGGCTIEGCVWDVYECDCVDCCPLIMDTSGRGYKLTSADRGVWFDINADGAQDAISWTDPTRDVAFLTFDRNANGAVDDGEELFGNVTPMPAGSATGRASHGFDALLSMESPAYGPSVRDGIIDSRDAAYAKLLLWVDKNHDGRSQVSELHRAADAGLSAIETRYRESKRQDEFGNEYRLRGISWWQRSSRVEARLFYDVWFVPAR